MFDFDANNVPRRVRVARGAESGGDCALLPTREDELDEREYQLRRRELMLARLECKLLNWQRRARAARGWLWWIILMAASTLAINLWAVALWGHQ
jgi:hypothetical protein